MERGAHFIEPFQFILIVDCESSDFRLLVIGDELIY